jgi:putative addiction module killer protein
LVGKQNDREPTQGIGKVYPRGYSHPVLQVRRTAVFTEWIDGLRDARGRARVQARIERLIAGNRGDARPVGEGVSEMRVDYGPGYRVYYVKRGREIVILLAGGDKSSQDRDIRVALQLARNM